MTEHLYEQPDEAAQIEAYRTLINAGFTIEPLRQEEAQCPNWTMNDDSEPRI